MNFALVYIASRLFYRLFDFFHHWYVPGSKRLAHFFISFLERLDRTLAIKITLKHFFDPLYKDYTVIGRIMGIIFRSLRVFAGAIVYSVFGVIFLALYLGWTVILPALIFMTAYAFSGAPPLLWGF